MEELVMYYKCLASHGSSGCWDVLGHMQTCLIFPLSCGWHLIVCTLLFCSQKPVACAATVFPNKEQNLQPECADTQEYVERRKVKQYDFYLCAFHSLQCRVACGHIQSISVSSSSVFSLGLSSVWIVTGWLGWFQKTAKNTGQVLFHDSRWPLYSSPLSPFFYQ